MKFQSKKIYIMSMSCVKVSTSQKKHVFPILRLHSTILPANTIDIILSGTRNKSTNESGKYDKQHIQYLKGERKNY